MIGRVLQNFPLERNVLRWGGGGKLNALPSSSPLTLVERFLLESINVLVELSSYYGLKLNEWESRRLRMKSLETWLNFLPNKSEGEAIKFVKYKSAAFFSSSKGLELPNWPFGLSTTDKPAILLGGKFRAWQRLLKLSSPEKYNSFLASVSIGWKKGCPRPSPSVVKDGVSSTFSVLTTPPVRPSWADETEEKLDFTESDMIFEIKRTIRELFRDVPFISHRAGVEPYLPSTSANYINSRSELGAVGYMLKENECLLPAYNLSDIPAEMISEDVGDERVSSLKLNPRKGNETFSSFMTNLQIAAKDEPANVKLVGLSEAFKVRVISKGPPISSTYLKFVQRWLWQTLSRTKTFKLIGATVTPLEVQNRIGALHEGEKFASVDYSAATDLLYSKYSNLVAAEIAEVSCMSGLDSSLFLRLLTQHYIEDPKTGVPTPQKRGQLMGSIVSFPILCILNAAVCRASITISRNGYYKRENPVVDSQSKIGDVARGGRKYVHLTLDQCPLLINGDDALMRITPEGYQAWLDISRIVGFSPSIGKTFYSEEFAQINSCNFDYVEPYYEEGRTIRFKRVPFINMGLLYGKVRSSSGNQNAVAVDSSGTMGMRMRELLKYAPESTHNRLSAAFISRNSGALKRCRLPWFLPEEVGGLGLVGKPSYEDEVYFAWAYRNLRGLPVSERPVALSEPAQWQIRLMALQSLRRLKCPERLLTTEEEEASVKAQTWLGAMQIFDQAVQADPGSVYKVAFLEGAVQTAIRKNERLIGTWKRRATLRAQETFYMPLTWSDPDGTVSKVPWEEYHFLLKTNPFPSIDFAVFLRNADDDLLFEPSWSKASMAHKQGRGVRMFNRCSDLKN